MELFPQMAGMGHDPQAAIAARPLDRWAWAGPRPNFLQLVRGFTYTAAAAGLNLGSGKAVIVGNPK